MEHLVNNKKLSTTSAIYRMKTLSMPLTMTSSPKKERISLIIVSKYSQGYLQKIRHLSSKNTNKSKDRQ